VLPTTVFPLYSKFLFFLVLTPLPDLNREVVVKDLQKLITLIADEELTTIALIVLFNLCNDFGTLHYNTLYGNPLT
jgi:hypothetical protein